MMHDEWTGVAQAVAATLCFSTGAMLVRLAGDLSPVEVTSLRLLLAAAFVGLAAWGGGERLTVSAREWARLVPIGITAALHFLAFIASLYFTTRGACPHPDVYRWSRSWQPCCSTWTVPPDVRASG